MIVDPLKIHLYWCDNRQSEGKENFGDLLPNYIVSKLSNKPIVRVTHPSMRRYRYFLKHYLTVGSILEAANENSIVWGSGIIRQNDVIKKAKFLAVRGPKTRKRLLELGYQVPEIYGDPALLLPTLYPISGKPEYELGIIPHYVDYEMISRLFSGKENVKVINLITDNVESVIDDIVSCKRILSTSLHGLIVPHAYGIPALWMKVSDKLAGDDVKFYDYFESVGLEYTKPFETSASVTDYESLFADNKAIALPLQEKINPLVLGLLHSNPFRK